jgi:flagellar protein FlaG
MDIQSTSSPALASTLSSLLKSTEGVTTQQPAEAKVVSSPTQQVASPEALQSQVEQVNSRLGELGIGVAFMVDESTKASVVKVIDKTTEEVLKQFPNEGSLRMMQNIQNYLETVQTGGAVNKEGLTGNLFSEII